MQRLPRRARHAVNLARERDVTLGPRLVGLADRRCLAIPTKGSAFHEAQALLAPASQKAKRRGRPKRRSGHDPLLRRRERKPDVPRFLTGPAVPLANNQAGRDGRMMKPRRKISGGFRSDKGASGFAVTRTLISTARKQGRDMLAALSAKPERLIAKLRTA